MFGRILGLYAGTAADQGYRHNVEAELNRAVEWCKYLGDVWGHIEAVTAIGRLQYYMLPADQPELAIGS